MKIFFLHIIYFSLLAVSGYDVKHSSKTYKVCRAGKGCAAKPYRSNTHTIISGDAILGEWIDDLKTVKISIYKENALYHAKVIWLKEPGLVSVGTSLMRNLSYAGNNSWGKGVLYYPRTKSWYQCNCTLATKSLLKLRVFSGIPIFGKTIYFNKAG
jgi:uncharacterized protein (DUF2147 family)